MRVPIQINELRLRCLSNRAYFTYCVQAGVSALILLTGFSSISHAQPATVKPIPLHDQWWQDRHESMNQRVAEGNVDLLMIGDSITHSWEDVGRKVWEKYYSPRNAVNLGIGGDQTQHVLWRLMNGNIEGISPKLAVLMIGTNNSERNTSEEIALGVEEIVKTLRKKLPNTKLLVLGIFPCGAGHDDPRRLVNDGANEIIKHLADGEMIHYLDIGQEFLLDDENRTLTQEIMPDLLHLTEASYETWAEAIEPTVKELMGEN